MESQLASWAVSLVIGAVGGNVGGALFKKLSLGPVWNTVCGILGGGAVGQVSGALLGGNGLSGILGNFVGAIVGGVVLMALVGWLKIALADKQ